MTALEEEKPKKGMRAAEIRRVIASARFEDIIEAFRPEHDFEGSRWASHCRDGETRFPCTNCQVEGGHVLRNTGARNPYYAVFVDDLSFRCDYCQHIGTRFEVEEALLTTYSLLETFLNLPGHRVMTSKPIPIRRLAEVPRLEGDHLNAQRFLESFGSSFADRRIELLVHLERLMVARRPS